MRKDTPPFANLWDDEAVQEIPFVPEIEGFEPVRKGKEKILAYYASGQ